jgi:hypothetical protein
MSLFVSLSGQTNFAISPPIEIPRRFQLFGFDEGFDPVGDEVKFRIYAPWDPFRAIGQYIYACVESFRDVADDTENLEKTWFAARKDGFIDQVRRHAEPLKTHRIGNIMPKKIDSKRSC